MSGAVGAFLIPGDSDLVSRQLFAGRVHVLMGNRCPGPRDRAVNATAGVVLGRVASIVPAAIVRCRVSERREA